MASSAKRERSVPRSVSPGAQRRPDGPSLDRLIQAQIGDKLRSMYGELSDQPVPDRLTQILAQLGREPKA